MSFVADRTFSGSVGLSFTAYGGTGTRTNQNVTGTLVIATGKTGSSTTKGDITYTVKAGDEVAKGTTLFLVGENNKKLVYQITKDGTYINPMEMLSING